MLYNALAATAVGLALGLPPAETAAALAEFRPIHRRSQVVTLPSGVHLINDCYNANPGSMAMALQTLMELKGQRPGRRRPGRHAGVGRRAAARTTGNWAAWPPAGVGVTW